MIMETTNTIEEILKAFKVMSPPTSIQEMLERLEREEPYEKDLCEYHHLSKPPVEHVAFSRYKGRKRKMNQYEYKALCCAMFPEEANKDMEGVQLPYHGIVMGGFCTEANAQPAYLVFCYDGYKRVVSKPEMIELPWHAE